VTEQDDSATGFAEGIVINAALVIPESELTFRFSRSGGPGGQHANRSETRVELLFDVSRSPSLNEVQRATILHRLRGAIDGEGVLRLVSTSTRSQSANRADVSARFAALLSSALRPRKRRIPTRPSGAQRERRLREKRTMSSRKRERRGEWSDAE
jgi:ribosome-associated protein